MGGFGSGKWMDAVGRKGAVDYSRVLSIKMLRVNGFFDCDTVGRIEWVNAAGEIVCCVEVETLLGADADKTPAVVLKSEVLSARGLEQRIKLTKTACNYGGFRWWFECPVVKDGVYCGNRSSKLYLPQGQLYFGCRACHDLTYESCQKSHKYDKVFGHIENSGVDSLSVTQALRLGGL
jgi:hypothetical protein